MKTDIKKEGNKLKVSVTIPERLRARDPSIIVNTKKVVELLLESGYNDINNYKIVKHGLCSTISHEQILNSEWIFEKKQPERSTNAKSTKSSKPAPRKRASRSRTTKKTTTTKSKEDKLLGTKDMGGV